MTNLGQIESEPLKEVLGEILEGQKLIQKQLKELDSKVEELAVEVKAWCGWLGNAFGAVLFVVSISFIGAFFGLSLSIAFQLWKGL